MKEIKELSPMELDQLFRDATNAATEEAKDIIEAEFNEGNLSYLDAIEELVNKCGMSPKEAEEIVSCWWQPGGPSPWPEDT